MFGFKRILVAQHERALLFRDRQLVRVLEPGVYSHWDPLGRLQTLTQDLGRALFDYEHAEVLMKSANALLTTHLETVSTAEHEIGLVYREEKLIAVVAPGERKLFWKAPYALRVERVDVQADRASRRTWQSVPCAPVAASLRASSRPSFTAPKCRSTSPDS